MFEWHNEAEKKWDERAEFWNQNSQEMWDHGSRSTIIPFFQNHIEPKSCVLDAGCGDGYGASKLSDLGFDVTGIDLSQQMIERASDRILDRNLQFVQGDLTKLPFHNEQFDGIMAINSLEWTENPLLTLKELRRVLRENGFLCIGLLGPTAMPRKNSFQRLYGENVICNTMMPWELEKLAEENGFVVIDGQGVYKREVSQETLTGLPTELKQALTFMWLFILQKK